MCGRASIGSGTGDGEVKLLGPDVNYLFKVEHIVTRIIKGVKLGMKIKKIGSFLKHSKGQKLSFSDSFLGKF